MQTVRSSHPIDEQSASRAVVYGLFTKLNVEEKDVTGAIHRLSRRRIDQFVKELAHARGAEGLADSSYELKAMGHWDDIVRHVRAILPTA